MEVQITRSTSSVRLTETSTNKLGWEIKIANDDLKKAVKELEEINNMMISTFKPERTEE